jgi:hypothetical protein
MTPEKRISYRIVLEGALDASWSDWLNGFEMQATSNHEGQCTTMLRVEVIDQAALRGVLNKIWDMNLELISLLRIDDQESPGESPIYRSDKGE